MRLTAAAATFIAACLIAPHGGAADPKDDPRYGPFFLRSGIALPYPTSNLFRGFADCRRGRHHHQALDIGGVGPDAGLGTPIRSLARSRIVTIGTPADDPTRRGTPLTDAATVTRGGRELPASREIPGYGTVFFFTQDYGTARTGTLISARVLEGRLAGHLVHYMHLAAVHPDLSVGDEVEAGQELGLMGGTAVLESPPHLHLTIKNKSGRKRDVGPILSVGRTAVQCRHGKKGERARRAKYTGEGREVMRILKERQAQIHDAATVKGCGTWTYEGDFGSGRFLTHRIRIPDGGGADADAAWEVSVTRTEGKWQPKLAVEDRFGRVVYDGHSGSRRDVRRHGLKRLANGKRGKLAHLRMRSRNEPVAVRVGQWRAKRKPPRNGKYTIAVSRPCATPIPAPQP